MRWTPWRPAITGLVGCALLVTAPLSWSGTTSRPAEPTLGPLLSGRTSLVSGTHVWTDYAYDDRGRNASSEPSYPDSAAPGNAADLIQLQLRPRAQTLHVRAVLETLTRADVPSVGVGIDTDSNPSTGAPGVRGGQWTVKADGTQLGLERLIVLERGVATVYAASGGRWQDSPVGKAPAVVDPTANTVSAAVPLSLLGSAGSRWRTVGVAGLADPEHSWVAGTGDIYDLAYVEDTTFDGQTFQSGVQASVLSGGEDAGKAMAILDLRALRAGTTALAKPVAGRKNTLLYRSALSLGEGISAIADRKYAGPYQPYVAWFPAKGLPARPPLVVFLHGASQTHLDGMYGGGSIAVDDNRITPGSLDLDAVLITPLGRSESALGYPGPSEQDLLDAIADATRRFRVDKDRVVVTGYSLGGVGTFNLAQFYPDRWAGAVEIVGGHDLGVLTAQEEAGGTQTLPNALENLRNLQFRMAHARLDELELLVQDPPDQAWLALEQLGYDVRYWQFTRREHVSFPVEMVQCELEAAIERGRVHNPARVVYSQEPAIVTRDAKTGLRLHHDRAYWMSDMVVRDAGEPGFAPRDKGTVDLTDLTRVDRTPKVTPVRELTENVSAGRDVCGPNEELRTFDTWTTLGNAWSRGADEPRINGLRAELTGVQSVRLDLTRLRGLDLTRTVVLELTSDGPSKLRLAGAWPGGVTIQRAGAAPVDACPRRGVLDVATAAGSSTVRLVPSTRRCR